MVTKNLLSLALALGFAPALVAGQNVGNGGAIVSGTCDGVDATKQVQEPLDFWEVRYRYGYERDLGADTLDVAAKLDVAFTRLARVDQARATLYRQWAHDFWQEEKDQDPRYPLPPLRDAGNITPNLPTGCDAVKVIEQVTPDSVLLVKRYFVRRDVFNKLGKNEQAGLILHELIYRDALARGHLTSMKARIVTGVLAAAVFDSFTPDQYEELMIENGLLGYMASVWPMVGIRRYFDHRLLGQADAVLFCNKLAGDSRIVGSSDYDFRPDTNEGMAFRASAIGRHILGDDNDGKAQFWTLNAQLPADVDNGGGATMPPVQPTAPLPFMCWQETDASPWTQTN